MSSPLNPVLKEANRKALWFPAIKVQPLWARVAGRHQTVHSREGDVAAEKGDYICRGTNGEEWPQKSDAFLPKYEPTEVTDKQWRQYLPRPETARVMAARIDHEFSVENPHGRLHGKAGDFLVKRAADRDTPHPVDVWIVGAEIFAKTYQRLDDESR